MKTFRMLTFMGTLFALISVSAMEAPKSSHLFTHTDSVEIQAPLQTVWKKVSNLRDTSWIFGANPEAKVERKIQEQGKTKWRRLVSLQDGRTLVENIIFYQKEHRVSFMISKGMPAAQYYVDFNVVSLGPNKTAFIGQIHAATFPFSDAEFAGLEKKLKTVYTLSLQALKKQLEN